MIPNKPLCKKCGIEVNHCICDDSLNKHLRKHTDYSKLVKYKFQFRHIMEYFNMKCDQDVQVKN